MMVITPSSVSSIMKQLCWSITRPWITSENPRPSWAMGHPNRLHHRLTFISNTQTLLIEHKLYFSQHSKWNNYQMFWWAFYKNHFELTNKSFFLPRASDFPGLIPDLLEEGVVLDNDCVFDVRSLGGWSPIAVRVSTSWHPALKNKVVIVTHSQHLKTKVCVCVGVSQLGLNEF